MALTKQDLQAVAALLDTGIAPLRKDIKALDYKVDYLFGELDKRVDGIEDTMSSMQGSITGMQDSITSVEGSITGLQGLITSLEGSLGSIQGSLTELQTTADRIERVQIVEVGRTDRNSLAIGKINRDLGLA